jgi:hypothetical protein
MTTHTADPWAELDALLTDAGIEGPAPGAQEVEPAPVLSWPDDSLALQVPEPLPAAAPAKPITSDTDAEQRRALTAKALQAAHHAIDVIAETFAARGADFDDAVKALPHLHRVLEHVEKLEAARKTASVMPTAVLTIVLDGTPQVAPARQRRPITEFTDITTD